MAAKQSLTKEETDDLSQAYTAANDGADRATDVRAYDFVHPDKLSRANLRALEMVFSALERSWSRTLASSLRKEVEVKVSPLEQASFGAYSETLPATGLIFTLSMGTLPGRTFVDMPAGLALSLVDRMAGGKGEAPDEPRQLTQIECGIVRRLVSRLASDLLEAWKPVANLAIRVSDCFQSREEIEMDAGELMVTVRVTWSIDSVETPVNIALPVNSLAPILEELDPHRWTIAEQTVQADSAASSITELVRTLDVSLSVELGHAGVTMQDVLGMEIGDVVRLDTNVNAPLPMKIGGRVRFHVRPGLRGNRISVQITDDTSAAMPVEDTQAMERAA